MPSPLPALPARFRFLPSSAAARVVLGGLILLAAVHLAASDGMRIGPWPVPPIPGWPIVSTAAMAALLVPSRPEPLSARGVAAAVLLLLAASTGAHELERRAHDGEPRLSALLYRPSQGDAAPEHVTLSSLRLHRKGVFRRLLSRSDDLRLELTAVLDVPRSGNHAFILAADDSAELALDGATVLRAAGTATAELPLSAGEHSVRLVYEQVHGPARLELEWRRPTVIDLLPLEWFLRTEGPPPDRARQWHRLVGAGAAALAAWTIGLGLLIRAGESRRHLRGRAAEGGRRLRVTLVQPAVAVPLVLGVAAAAGLLAAEAVSRPLCADGLRFQPYSSEYLMQTVSAADLRLEPLRSLWYLHIQPPLFDAIRAVLARSWPGGPEASLIEWVDRGLYLLFAGGYGALIGLLCAWLWRTASPRAALAGALAFALHPAAVAYASVLDSTFLGAALFAWFCCELWAWRPGRGVARLAAAVLLLFLARSAFQWPFLLVVLVAFAIRGGRGRELARFALLAIVPIGLFLGKQWLLFGSPITSTFAAYNFCRGLGSYCPGDTPVPLPGLPDPAAAMVLRRATKLDGEYNYNQVAFLRRSFSQRAEYVQKITSQPLTQTARAFLVNAGFYLRPSSRYTTHVLADGMPWRDAYDVLFSGWRLIALLAAGVAAWWWRTPREVRARGAALALPVLYVAAVTIVFERGENNRYKFIVEPVLWTFFVTQAHAVVAMAARR